MTSWFCLRLGSLFHEHKFNMNLNMTLISRSQTGWREKLDMKQLYATLRYYLTAAGCQMSGIF